MRQLREFTETDWYGMAGAEPGRNGEAPQVAYDTDATVVVDRYHITVEVYDSAPDGTDEDTVTRTYTLDGCGLEFPMLVYIASHLPTAADLRGPEHALASPQLIAVLTQLGFVRAPWEVA